MAPSERALTVIFSQIAIDELQAIWQWNAKNYGPLHANAYDLFLRRRIADLARGYDRGRGITGHPELRYLLIRRKAKGHGHLAVYRVDDRAVNVLHVFHTAQDWSEQIT